MNETALINGIEYQFIELLPALGKNQTMVLCKDSGGAKYICSEELWGNNAVIKSPALVHANSSTQEKIEFFLSVFKGREGLYAKRYYSTNTGKSGYTPVCKNEWVAGVCNKKAHKCPDCPNRLFASLTADVAKAHLMGRDSYCRDVVAIYPMLEDNTTWLLVADFDEANWQADVREFCKTCEEVGLTPAVERSRSGNGAHVWFFFSEPVSAADARKLGSGLLTQTMSRRHELSFASYDRLFPAQDSIPKGGFGNLIALPFQGQAQQKGNSLFVNDQFVPYPDQWAFLSSLPKIDAEHLEKCLTKLCSDSDIGEMSEIAKAPIPWPHKKSRKHLTNADFPLQANLMVSNLIYVDKHGFSQAALNAVKRLAAFPNPDFRLKQAMHIPVYGIPRILDCGYKDENVLGIPRGCMDSLQALLDTHEVPVSIEDQRYRGRAIDVSFSGTLRPEQEPAAKALLEEDIGVLSATTAFGKTVIGAYLIGQRKVNTLILVHSSALLEQWKSSLEQFLDIREVLPEPPKKRGRKKKLHLIGQIGAGKNTRNGIVDIAIMQSLFESEDKSVKSFVSEYGMVIVDECHHVAAFTFESILKTVEAKYIYGLSATPIRKDGHHPIIFMQCGPVRYLVDAKRQAEKRSFSHYVVPRFTRTRLPSADSIQDLYSGVVENETRNEFIISDALKLVQEGRTPILLTERKEHATQLASQLTHHLKHIFLLLGSDKPKDKREKLTALQSVPANESMIVVATGKYIGEGFDAPRLDTLLLAMPISWQGTLAQYAGRLHRNYEGKQEVRIYDYVDIHVPTLERMYHKRLKGYSELGYQVKFGGQDSNTSIIYGSQDFVTPFTQDLSDAARSILIVSPHIHPNKVSRLLSILEAAVSTGVSVAIYTKAAESYASERQAIITAALNLLEATGASVFSQEDIPHHYAIIDESVVWFGNIDFLAFGRKDADVLRFENADIAGELLELLVEKSDTQLTIEDIS